jgi:hypothetical protein
MSFIMNKSNNNTQEFTSRDEMIQRFFHVNSVKDWGVSQENHNWSFRRQTEFSRHLFCGVKHQDKAKETNLVTGDVYSTEDERKSCNWRKLLYISSNSQNPFTTIFLPLIDTLFFSSFSFLFSSCETSNIPLSRSGIYMRQISIMLHEISVT